MNDNNFKLLAISHDVKYLFTNRGILETSMVFQKGNGRFIEYTHDNLPIGLEMLKEHFQTFYNAGQISLLEYSNSPRKVLYNLMEILQPTNSTQIIKEWEELFGDKLLLINESVDKLLVENRVNNAWNGVSQILEKWTINPFNSDFYTADNWSTIGSGVAKGVKNAAEWTGGQIKKGVDWGVDQVKQIRDKGFLTWAGEKVSAVWESIKSTIAAAYNCITSGIECIMEGIREASLSAIGMGVMTAVSFIPAVGQVADVVVFGSLLIWDIYKMLSGKYETGKYAWNWFDIIIDAVCCIVPFLGKGLKEGAVGIKTMEQLGTKAATEGGIFRKVLNALKGGLGKITSAIGQGIKFLGEKLGLEFLTKWGSKVEGIIGKGIKEATAAEAKAAAGAGKSFVKRAGEKLGNIAKNFKLTKPLSVVVKKTGKTVLVTAALCSALGLDGWSCKHKIESGEVTPEQIANAEKEIQAGLKSGQVKKQMDQMSVADAEKAALF